ncbi:MAG TPA: deoxynucleoside kinase [Bacteroidia bacterium]|jgi:deoxyguanosine kinase|nr:deoxynucleoside kinase [Bacteroidia bacterium]
MDFNFICIEGNIGVGKTTLVKKLAEHLGVFAFYEEFEENPWLPLFYENPEETALSLELSFLTDRIKQLNKIKKEHGQKIMLSDYSLDKCLLFTKINLNESDFIKYKKLHEAVSKTIDKPSLVIVIHSDIENLQKNIRERNRSYEQKIENDYLQKLNIAYKDFFKEEKAYTILNIFTPQLDEKAYERIFKEIAAFVKLKPTFKNTFIEL